MANTLHVSLLEMLLLKGIANAPKTDWFEDEAKVRWIYDTDCARYVGARNLKKSVDKAVGNGMIELDGDAGEEGVGIRMTKLGEKIFKAAEPKDYEVYQKNAA